MRGYSDILAFRGSLIGSLNAALTAIGAPVDTIGFGSVMAVVCAGAAVGSNTSFLDIKIKESGVASGTGSAWTDITDGGVLKGSFSFAQMTFAGTNPALTVQKVYEHIGSSDGNRKRFIRPVATCSGTVGAGIRFAVNFLLGRPADSLYVAADKTAVSIGTGNTDTSWNKI